MWSCTSELLVGTEKSCVFNSQQGPEGYAMEMTFSTLPIETINVKIHNKNGTPR